MDYIKHFSKMTATAAAAATTHMLGNLQGA
jgi:hypothetical protein